METVNVGFPNEGEQTLRVCIVEKWIPKNINYIGNTVFFNHGDMYFSMRKEDFNKIFKL